MSDHTTDFVGSIPDAIKEFDAAPSHALKVT